MKPYSKRGKQDKTRGLNYRQLYIISELTFLDVHYQFSQNTAQNINIFQLHSYNLQQIRDLEVSSLDFIEFRELLFLAIRQFLKTIYSVSSHNSLWQRSLTAYVYFVDRNNFCLSITFTCCNFSLRLAQRVNNYLSFYVWNNLTSLFYILFSAHLLISLITD